jgi:ubiquinone/menaquinone biosynthesis C-methylase UbiE
LSTGTSNLEVRERWLEKTIKKIPDGYRILDAGAGELLYKKYCSHLQYVSQDFAKYDGTGDGSGLQTSAWDQTKLDIISDITSIPEPDASFDAIMCIEVFEHLPDPVLAIEEFSRLLRDGGKLIITAPFCSLTHFAPYHFFTGFNRYFYEKHLPAYGFIIKELIPNGNFFEYIAQEIRRSPGVAEQYSKDRPTRDELLGMQITLKMLHHFSKKDIGSGELLNHGYHVIAEKQEVD